MAEGIRGNLAQLSLLDILRMLSTSNRSGRLDINQAGKSGEIYLERGSIVHAVTGTQIGDKGVYTLMGWLEGDFVFTSDTDVPERSIDTSTEQILLEAARQAEQWEDIKDVLSSTDAVFNISPSGSTNTVSLKPVEWQVLAQVNGQRSVIEIGEILELHEFEVARIIYSLTTAGLLHEVTDAKSIFRDIVDETFFDQLTAIYTEVMGPIGPIIIEDEIKLLGEDRNAFPQDKAAELVERMSLEISDSSKRAQFQKQMVAVIRG
ncbi:MAG: DUF4388 domain-containing protein [Anaerolineales bacterium]|nr:DUF4388 domain-containing protein [Anaerolineales bacterium]